MPLEHACFIVENLDGRFNPAAIQQKLDSLHGVSSARVNPQHLVQVSYSSAQISYDGIENCLNHLGCGIRADASRIESR